MNYYKRHIGDILKDTSHLTLPEHGAYTRLQDLYYTREAALPADENQVARLLTVRNDAERAVIVSVLHEFWTLTDAGWTQKRCEEELQAYLEKAEANRENGSKGGRPKGSGTQKKPTNNPGGSKGKPNGKRPAGAAKTQMVPKSNLFPVANSHEPLAIIHTQEDARKSSGTDREPNGNQDGYCERGGARTPESERVGTDVHSTPERAVATDRSDDPDGWARCRRSYPDGTYEAKSFLIGEREARRRIDEGHTWAELEAGTQRMADQAGAKGIIGTQYVPSPAKFYAQDPQIPGTYPFQGEFKLPRPSEKPNTLAAQERDALRKLKDRRAAIGLAGFRDPTTGETAEQYRQAQDQAFDERARGRAGPRFGSTLPATKTEPEPASPEQIEVGRPREVAAQVARLLTQVQAGTR